jgi:hypothetical protein
VFNIWCQAAPWGPDLFHKDGVLLTFIVLNNLGTGLLWEKLETAGLSNPATSGFQKSGQIVIRGGLL